MIRSYLVRFLKYLLLRLDPPKPREHQWLKPLSMKDALDPEASRLRDAQRSRDYLNQSYAWDTDHL